MDNQPVLLPYRGRTAFLGRWVLGSPVGSSAFEKLPRLPKLADARDPREKLDILTAGKGLGIKPRLLFDDWAAARTALNEFAQVENRLTAAGFTHQALQNELWKAPGGGKDALAVLRETAATAFDAHDFIVKETARLGVSYFEPEQTEAAQAVFDAVLAQKHAAAPPAERVRLRYSDDVRLLAALSRAPRAISEIQDAELDEMRARYVEVHFPHSHATFAALEDCIDPPRRTVREGLHIIGTACGRKPAELVSGWGAAGEWIVDEAA